jgi:hypothetical protein
LDAAARALHRQEDYLGATTALIEYEDRNALFSVDRGTQRLYPAFQFDSNLEPLPAMADILRQVPRSARSWSLLSGFDARNALLDTSRPRDLIAQQPEAVMRAAGQFYRDSG